MKRWLYAFFQWYWCEIKCNSLALTFNITCLFQFWRWSTLNDTLILQIYILFGGCHRKWSSKLISFLVVSKRTKAYNVYRFHKKHYKKNCILQKLNHFLFYITKYIVFNTQKYIIRNWYLKGHRKYSINVVAIVLHISHDVLRRLFHSKRDNYSRI